MLGVLFVWFGALKVVGQSPVATLVQQTLPFGHHLAALPLLGGVEVVLGVFLISGTER